MKRAFLEYLGLALVALLAIGCGDSGSLCGEDEIECDGECVAAVENTLESVHANVFALSCAFSSCHDSEAPQEMLDLSSVDAAEADLIGVPSMQDPQRLRVAPGDSDSSYLVDKLLGRNLANVSGTDDPSQQMPLGGVLCDSKLQAVQAWIDSGAN